MAQTFRDSGSKSAVSAAERAGYSVGGVREYSAQQAEEPIHGAGNVQGQSAVGFVLPGAQH
jgi:hypothetical protein